MKKKSDQSMKEFTNWVAPSLAVFQEEMRNEEQSISRFPDLLVELYETAKIIELTPSEIMRMQRGEGQTPPGEWLQDPTSAPNKVDPTNFRYHKMHHKSGQILDRFKNNEPLFMPIVSYSPAYDRYTASSGRHRIAYSQALGIRVMAFCIDGELLELAHRKDLKEE